MVAAQFRVRSVLGRLGGLDTGIELASVVGYLPRERAAADDHATRLFAGE